jgi:protein ImuA
MRAAKALSSLLHEVSHEQHIASEATVTALHAQVWRADEVAASAATRATMPTGFAALDAEFPGAGWPRSQLIELLVERAGTGELSLLAPALVQTSRERRACVWVLPRSASGPSTATQEVLPYGPALQGAGVNLAQHIFVKPGTTREAFWAIEQSLRTAHLGALICWLPASSSVDTEFRALRRLHLLASQTRTLLFALRGSHCLSAPSPAALRLQLEPRDGQLQVHILKRRGRPLLEPLAVQIHPAHWHTARVHGVPSTQTHAQVAPATASASAAQRTSQPQRWSWQALFAH